MGGSVLGTKAIYSFLEKKIRKKIYFIDNLNPKIKGKSIKAINIIISKSGNTLETISNSNLILKKIQKIFLLPKRKTVF